MVTNKAATNGTLNLASIPVDATATTSPGEKRPRSTKFIQLELRGEGMKTASMTHSIVSGRHSSMILSVSMGGRTHVTC